nr:copia protein [Tanacetum cinerariifolium]
MQRFLRLAGFLGAAVGTEEEQAKNFQWGLRRSTLNHLMCMSYTDVAQVVNAARNYEILHERDYDITDNSVSNQSALDFDQYFELNELKAQSQEKDTVIMKLKERIIFLSGNVNEDKSVEISNLATNLHEQGLIIEALKDELRKLKGKALVDNAVTIHSIAPEILKIDMEPLAPRLLNNRTAHFDYLKITQEQAMILRKVVEQGKSQNPLNNSLALACKYSKRIQELLIIVRHTCPSINNSSYKLVDLTPKNKDKRVRFIEPVTSSGTTNTKTASLLNLVSNKPMLSSKGVKPSTSASRSQPSGNTKKDRIQGPPRTAIVQHSKLNANSKLICVKCNGCMLYDNYDLCVLNVVNDVNTLPKSKSVKITSKRKVWKPAGKIGNVTILRVCYIEGIGHNLFFVGQFCYSNLEVAFRQHTCCIRNPEGVDLLTGSQDNNLYTPFLRDMMASSPICLLSKALKTKSWLWHRCLSHLNFGALDHLARHGLVRGLPKLKFEKDHLCSACAMGKSKKKPYKLKSKDTNQEKLYLLYMDLYGPMRVASVNGKNYILIIVDDYS